MSFECRVNLPSSDSVTMYVLPERQGLPSCLRSQEKYENSPSVVIDSFRCLNCSVAASAKSSSRPEPISTLLRYHRRVRKRSHAGRQWTVRLRLRRGGAHVGTDAREHEHAGEKKHSTFGLATLPILS